jgi:hypothetical protein
MSRSIAFAPEPDTNLVSRDQKLGVRHVAREELALAGELLPTPGLLGACSRARQGRGVHDGSDGARRGLPARAARAACAGLAPPKHVLGRGPARKREGRAAGGRVASPWPPGIRRA